MRGFNNKVAVITGAASGIGFGLAELCVEKRINEQLFIFTHPDLKAPVEMRMGDILQMTPLIQGLRETHPEARISMVLNEAFLEVAQRIDVDRILPLPMRSFLHGLLGHKGLCKPSARIISPRRKWNSWSPHPQSSCAGH